LTHIGRLRIQRANCPDASDGLPTHRAPLRRGESSARPSFHRLRFHRAVAACAAANFGHCTMSAFNRSSIPRGPGLPLRIAQRDLRQSHRQLQPPPLNPSVEHPRPAAEVCLMRRRGKRPLNRAISPDVSSVLPDAADVFTICTTATLVWPGPTC
jgi:hypothetical protein